MTYLPELKIEVIELINVANDTSIAAADVDFGLSSINDDNVSIDIIGQGNNYFNHRRVQYTRRDLAKFFTNIPVIARVDDLPETFTGAELVSLLNTYWPGVFNPTDFLTDEMSQTYTKTDTVGKSITLTIDSTSKSWTGALSVSVQLLARTLPFIWKIVDVNLYNPTELELKSWQLDFTPFTRFIAEYKTGNVIDDDTALLLEQAIGLNVLHDSMVLYNGPTDSSGLDKVNTDYGNVLLLSPVDTSKGTNAFIYYGAAPVSLVTEDGDAMTTESGDTIVAE